MKRSKIFTPETLDQGATQGKGLEIMCKRCGRTIVVECFPLLRLAHVRRWETDLITFGKRLRCTVCRTRYPQTMLVDRAPDHPAIGITSDAQYTAMVQRLRG